MFQWHLKSNISKPKYHSRLTSNLNLGILLAVHISDTIIYPVTKTRKWRVIFYILISLTHSQLKSVSKSSWFLLLKYCSHLFFLTHNHIYNCTHFCKLLKSAHGTLSRTAPHTDWKLYKDRNWVWFYSPDSPVPSTKSGIVGHLVNFVWRVNYHTNLKLEPLYME